jgi:TIR domain
MLSKGSARTEIFISYSHKDKKWLEDLQVHLKPLMRDNHVEVWDDTRLRPGSRWRHEIREAIQRARAAVLLISPHFMASDFIHQSELPSLLTAAQAEGVTVLPVILRSSSFDRDARLNQFQTVNNPSQPLIDMRTGKRDVVFEKLAETIALILSRPSSSLSVARRKAPDGRESDLPEEATDARAAQDREDASTVDPATRAIKERRSSPIWPAEVIQGPRIYVSAPADTVLSDKQRVIKSGVLRAVSEAGLQPQEFGISGLPAGMAWTFDAADEVMNNCQGALILALVRFRVYGVGLDIYAI